MPLSFSFHCTPPFSESNPSCITSIHIPPILLSYSFDSIFGIIQRLHLHHSHIFQLFLMPLITSLTTSYTFHSNWYLWMMVLSLVFVTHCCSIYSILYISATQLSYSDNINKWSDDKSKGIILFIYYKNGWQKEVHNICNNFRAKLIYQCEENIFWYSVIIMQ